VDDTMVGLLEFPNGVLSRFECSIESHERHGAELSGTGGSIRIASPWTAGREGGRLVLCRDGAPDEVTETPGADAYACEVADFAAAVRGEAPPRWGLDDAVANMAVIDALYASAREGRAVAITP
jgi:predicted dehydrogenase